MCGEQVWKMKKIIDNFTKEQIQEIVNSSFTKRQVAIKLGYSANSGSAQTVLIEYFQKNNIDTSALTKTNKKYTKKEVFSENGTIAQHSLVSWYKKENPVYQFHSRHGKHGKNPLRPFPDAEGSRSGQSHLLRQEK